MNASVSNHLLAFLQRLLPARWLSRVIYKLSRVENSGVKNLLIRGFCLLYPVNTREARKSVPEEFQSFNDFFTRNLIAGARPVTDAPGAICCPADGTIAQLGFAKDGALIQAKGINYRADDLLADAELATSLRNSAFVTIYLAPHNYHRVHMPIDGTLEQSTHIPGRLFSVNAATTATLKGLYVRNERLVCRFRRGQGNFAVILVGAMNVGSFNTSWTGEIVNDTGEISRHWYAADNQPPELRRGDYLGHFNLGSTVIFIAPPEHLRWAKDLKAGDKVRMGMALGQLQSQ